MINPENLYIVYDIETRPADNLAQYIEQVEIKPDRRLKDPAKIEADIAAKREQIADRAGLSWWTGAVCCIGAVNIENDDKFSVADSDEHSILERFFMWMQYQRPIAREIPYLIGKSSRDFDRAFIVGRCLHHNIGVPAELRRTSSDLDVDAIFGYSRSHDQCSNLNNYAWGCGIAGKTDGMDGSQVAGLYAAGEYEKIREYCMGDVMITAEILRRYLKVF